MGFFGKKETGEAKKEAIPTLPELPKLPLFTSSEEKTESLPQLPDFPRNALGDRFSRDTIKKAINGKKEEEGEDLEDDFSTEKMQMTQEFPQKQIRYSLPEKETKNESFERIEEIEKKMREYTSPRSLIGSQIPEGFEDAGKRIKEAEPIFVRIDRFEESRKIFQKTKEQIFEIEKALGKIKSIKQEEDKELASWEQEILNIKEKISKVERDLFSKI